MSRINADKVLQVEAGVKCEGNEKAIPITAHNGDVFIAALNGRIILEASEIIMNGETNVKMTGSRIQIGYNQGGATDQVDINGAKIHINPGSKCTLKVKYYIIIPSLHLQVHLLDIISGTIVSYRNNDKYTRPTRSRSI